MSSKKKILVFSTVYYPIVGGAEVAMREISNRTKGFEYDMICARMDRNEAAEEQAGNIRVHKVGLGFPIDKFLLPFLGFFKAVSLSRKNGYSLVWCMMASQASIAAAWFKRKNPGIPLLLTLQEGDEEDHLKRYVFGSGFLYELLIKPWHTLVFKHADQATAISRYLKKRALKNGFDKEIALVPNAVDIERFAKAWDQEELRLFRRGYAGPEERIIITTSRLVPKNGTEDLIMSLKHLPENYKVLILGKGPDEEKLRQLAKREELSSRVLFEGYVEAADIPKYLKISDVFCRPSLSEGLGNSFIEAMAARVPVVATPVGGIVDFLFDPESAPDKAPTGLFCAVSDPPSIARAVLRIMEEEALRKKMVDNAYSLAVKKYDWKTIARQMEALFTGISK